MTEGPPAKPHILVANDETLLLDLLQELLTDEGYEVTCTRESREAYHLIKRVKPDLVILDVRMGNEVTGFDLVSMLMLDPETNAIPLIVSSADSAALRQHQQEMGNQGIRILAKPFDLDDLLRLIRQRLDEARAAS